MCQRYAVYQSFPRRGRGGASGVERTTLPTPPTQFYPDPTWNLDLICLPRPFLDSDLPISDDIIRPFVQYPDKRGHIMGKLWLNQYFFSKTIKIAANQDIEKDRYVCLVYCNQGGNTGGLKQWASISFLCKRIIKNDSFR